MTLEGLIGGGRGDGGRPGSDSWQIETSSDDGKANRVTVVQQAEGG